MWLTFRSCTFSRASAQSHGTYREGEVHPSNARGVKIHPSILPRSAHAVQVGCLDMALGKSKDVMAPSPYRLLLLEGSRQLAGVFLPTSCINRTGSRSLCWKSEILPIPLCSHISQPSQSEASGRSPHSLWQGNLSLKPPNPSLLAPRCFVPERSPYYPSPVKPRSLSRSRAHRRNESGSFADRPRRLGLGCPHPSGKWEGPGREDLWSRRQGQPQAPEAGQVGDCDHQGHCDLHYRLPRHRDCHQAWRHVHDHLYHHQHGRDGCSHHD
ncbi:hypothetical protein VTK56DRAFT_5188 [Thermocarpiscus australiensis]